MTDIDLKGMRESAERATPGPWKATQNLDVWIESNGRGVAQCGDIRWIGSESVVNDEAQMKANGRFIAHFDPPTVLSLLDLVETYKERMEKAEALVEKLTEERDGLLTEIAEVDASRNSIREYWMQRAERAEADLAEARRALGFYIAEKPCRHSCGQRTRCSCPEGIARAVLSSLTPEMKHKQDAVQNLNTSIPDKGDGK